jgi:hypothetical protein
MKRALCNSFYKFKITSRSLILNTVILVPTLYCSDIWSPTLREEHRLEVFKNRILRSILLWCYGKQMSINITSQQKKKQLEILCNNVLTSIIHYITECKVLCFWDITRSSLDPFDKKNFAIHLSSCYQFFS